MSRFIALVLAVVICATPMGCVSSNNPNTSDAERTRTEGTVTGAGAGAVIGGIIGAVVGGDTKGALIGAAIGAAAGGAAGYAYGNHVASKKAEYAKEEDWLDQCLASAQQVNKETLAYNGQLRTDIAQLETKTRELEAQYAAQKTGKEALLAEKKTIDAALKTTNEKLDRAKFERDSQKQALAQVAQKDSAGKSKALDAEITKLEGLINELEQHSENLAGMSGRMSV